MINTTRQARLFAYLLPSLHVLACLTTAAANAMNLGAGWEYIGTIDYPISILVVGLAWRYNLSPFALFATIGTLWWYVLNRLAFYLFGRLK